MGCVVRRPPALRSLVLVALMIGAMLLAACSTGGASDAVAPGEQAAAVDASEATPDDDQGPDPLPDPGVGPGECDVVTYTPPTAEEEYEGELCRPDDEQRDVVVMLVHGGSGVGGARTGMRPWATRLLAEGYVVFMPSYHLFSPGSESPVFPLPEQNLKAAVQFLRGTANATGTRRDRVVVQGSSAGARLGSVLYTQPNDPYFAGDELWPDISDEVNGFIGFYHTYDGTMQFASQYYGGNDDSRDADVRERWDHADAMANAPAAVGPALFITGDRDWELIEEHQQQFATRLRAARLRAEVVVIKSGSHGFDLSGSSRLTRLGEQAALDVLEWLNDRFPQDPERDASVSSVDLATAPDYSGAPPPTYETRRRVTTPRPTTTTIRSSATSSSLTTTSTSSLPPTTETTAPPETTTTVTTAPPTSTTATSIDPEPASE
jgi:acetyl esterase/lipase